MVFMILLRTVHRDISRYNQVDLDDEIQEDFGWKLVHGEVFRPPKKRMLLSVAVGSGAQMLAMSGVTLGESGSQGDHCCEGLILHHRVQSLRCSASCRRRIEEHCQRSCSSHTRSSA